MSEELNQEVVVETPAENTEVQQPQYTEQEQLALEKGWKPKSEYTGDPSKWRSAETFLALDEPLKRIESQSKELRRVREALEALHTHHKRVKESEYDRALKTLQEARKTAFRDGETEQAFAIEDRIEELKSERENIVIPELPLDEPQVAPEFLAWTESNSWYTADKKMRAVADVIGLELHSQGVPPAEVLKRVAVEIRKEFPHKFQNEKTARPNAVESSTRSPGKSTDTFQISDEDRRIMRKIVSTGVMTEAEYIKELKAVSKGN